jgi:glyoxylase-like metal-dependent hydrolase (beta-lactamase superfamily II)
VTWSTVAPPQEVAPGVYCAVVGKGLLRANIFLVRAGSSWSLVDAGSAGCAASILSAAQTLFGSNQPASAILLTHNHPDHAGAARELARLWACSVWVHPDELPLTLGELSVVRNYANPLDRRVVLPMLRLFGPRRARAIVARSSLEDVARAFDPTKEPPGLPDWEVVPTPGHTPGHVAFFRRVDRVLISGDALVTVSLNSWRGLLLGRRELSRPPWYTTWDREAAERSVRVLADLEPRVIAGGHGVPLAGNDTASLLRRLAES